MTAITVNPTPESILTKIGKPLIDDVGVTMVSNAFSNKLLGRSVRKAGDASDGFNFRRTDVVDFDDPSAEVYERRAEIPKRMSKGDWWIVLALYAAISAIAFVAM